MYDVLIVGAGPAGLSAALTCANRGKSVCIVNNPNRPSRLCMAHRIDNALGHTSVTGQDLWRLYVEQVMAKGVTWVDGVVDEIIHGDEMTVVLEEDVLEAKSLILAMGASTQRELPGESTLVGRGVSYCATCDGNFFAGKSLVAWIESLEHGDELEFLREVAGQLHVVVAPTGKAAWDAYEGKSTWDDVTVMHGTIQALHGTEQLESVEVLQHGESHTLTAEGLFIFRPMKALTQTLDGLVVNGSQLEVNAVMETNLPGVFGAGDVVGAPWQVDTAIGRGQVAALSAIAYISKR